jgi:hypothetical protein
MDELLKDVAADHAHAEANANLPLFCPTVEQILRSHLHLEGTVNTHVSYINPGERWHTTNMRLERIGATTGPLENFLYENLTWINLRPPAPGFTTQISSIITAISASTRARTAGLFHLDEEQLATSQANAAGACVRLCRIATFPPHTVSLLTPHPLELSSSLAKSTNNLPIHLLLAETVNIQPIDVSALRTALLSLVPAISVHFPWAYPSSNFTISTRRTSPLRYPTLPFLQTLTFLLKPRDNPSHIETHNGVAAALGILPINLAKQLKYHKHIMERPSLDAQTIKDIQAILRHAAVTCYTRYEKFMKQDIFGDFG